MEILIVVLIMVILIVNVSTALIIINVIKYSIKSTKDKYFNYIKNDIIKVDNKIIFSDIMLEFLEDLNKNYDKYIIDSFCIKGVIDRKFSIWIANGYTSLSFYCNYSIASKEEVEKWNKNLTKYDKLILKEIYDIFKNNKEPKFFLIYKDDE